jgi:hypothetical protein
MEGFGIVYRFSQDYKGRSLVIYLLVCISHGSFMESFRLGHVRSASGAG